jgi:putative protease
MLMNGSEKLKLVFDCKPCEMHVVGKIKRNVMQQKAREVQTSPITFYQARP